MTARPRGPAEPGMNELSTAGESCGSWVGQRGAWRSYYRVARRTEGSSMFDGRDLDDAERLVDDWQAGIEARAAQARELATRLGALTATARSADGLVSVTVGSSGGITDLVLKEGIRDRPAAETARAILATLRAAQSSL